jgi:hypothetical protein
VTESEALERYDRGPSRDELVAAGQVVDLFASEALLALDRYERSFPESATDRERQVANRLAYWWRKLEMDGEVLDPRGSDAEQILGTAAGLALDPQNEWGVSVEYAAGHASGLAVAEGRPAPATTIDDLRGRFDQEYGGEAGEPELPDDWLAQSLTRLSRASVLRDVIAAGARVSPDESLRKTTDELVRQGQQLMDQRRGLTVLEEQPPKAPSPAQWHLRNFVATAGFSAGLTAASDVAVQGGFLAVGALYATGVGLEVRKLRHAFDHWLDPAQAQLRSVRGDLINSLDGAADATQRAARSARGADRGGRGR